MFFLPLCEGVALILYLRRYLRLATDNEEVLAFLLGQIVKDKVRNHQLKRPDEGIKDVIVPVTELERRVRSSPPPPFPRPAVSDFSTPSFRRQKSKFMTARPSSSPKSSASTATREFPFLQIPKELDADGDLPLSQSQRRQHHQALGIMSGVEGASMFVS